MDEKDKGFYFLRPCRGAIGFVANPKKNIWLDLGHCVKKLEESGFKVIDAKVMLIAQNDIELTIYKSGKILARTDDDEAAMSAIEKAYEILL
jgi:hypothetical protein